MMRYYKKNPEIKGTIFVQGVMFDDNTVVCGDEFEIFADPTTFPGNIPKLVMTEPDGTQKKQADAKAQEKAATSGPRHLPPTSSSSMMNSPEGIVIPNKEVLHGSEETQPKVESVIEITPSPKEEKKQSMLLSDITNAEMILSFPGVGPDNVVAIKKAFATLQDLSSASNIELKKCGVKPTNFQKIRDRAIALIEENGK